MVSDKEYKGFSPLPEANKISVRRASLNETDALAAIARREVGPGTADASVVRRVMAHNGEGFFSVLRTGDAERPSEIIGFYAHLFLNADGVQALLAGTFDGANPDLAYLCTAYDKPRAMYGWCAVARGVHRLAAPLAMRQLAGARYRGLDFYSRATTEAGVRSLERIGCVPARLSDAPGQGCLYVKRARRAEAA